MAQWYTNDVAVSNRVLGDDLGLCKTCGIKSGKHDLVLGVFQRGGAIQQICLGDCVMMKP